MKFADLQKRFQEGALTEDVLEEENVAPGDFIKLREDTQCFETFGSGAKEPKKVRSRTYNYVFVTETAIGMFKDVPLATGWNLKEFRRRHSPILFGHDSHIPPVGRGLTVQRNKDYEGVKAMLGQVEFAPEGLSEQADLVEAMVGAGYLNCGSVGFNIKKMREPTKDEIKKYGLGKYSAIFEKMDLIEYSVVSLGRDPNAGVIYTEEGKESFERWLADNRERFSTESIMEVRETILCEPSGRTYHALRSWSESEPEGVVDDEPSFSFDFTSSGTFGSDDKEQRIVALEEQVRSLTERFDAMSETEPEEEEEMVFGVPLSRAVELISEEIND